MKSAKLLQSWDRRLQDQFKVVKEVPAVLKTIAAEGKR